MGIIPVLGMFAKQDLKIYFPCRPGHNQALPRPLPEQKNWDIIR